MSDASQGEGWWEASDGKMYPPEDHPDYVDASPAPPERAAAVATSGSSANEQAASTATISAVVLGVLLVGVSVLAVWALVDRSAVQDELQKEKERADGFFDDAVGFATTVDELQAASVTDASTIANIMETATELEDAFSAIDEEFSDFADVYNDLLHCWITEGDLADAWATLAIEDDEGSADFVAQRVIERKRLCDIFSDTRDGFSEKYPGSFPDD